MKTILLAVLMTFNLPWKYTQWLLDRSNYLSGNAHTEFTIRIRVQILGHQASSWQFAMQRRMQAGAFVIWKLIFCGANNADGVGRHMERLQTSHTLLVLLTVLGNSWPEDLWSHYWELSHSYNSVSFDVYYYVSYLWLGMNTLSLVLLTPSEYPQNALDIVDVYEGKSAGLTAGLSQTFTASVFISEFDLTSICMRLLWPASRNRWMLILELL